MAWQEQDWKARESGILALGAISEGCAAGLLHYLADMVAALLPLLTDTRPLVRSITCWALSRYSRWIVEKGREPQSQGQRQMEAVIQVGRSLICQEVCESGREQHVQDSRCSKLSRGPSIPEPVDFLINNGLLVSKLYYKVT